MVRGEGVLSRDVLGLQCIEAQMHNRVANLGILKVCLRNVRTVHMDALYTGNRGTNHGYDKTQNKKYYYIIFIIK